MLSNYEIGLVKYVHTKILRWNLLVNMLKV